MAVAFAGSDMQRGPAVWVGAVYLDIALLRVLLLQEIDDRELVSFLRGTPELPR